MEPRPFRDWWADRLTVGWIVRRIWPEYEIRLGPTHCYVIRHPRFVWYMRDPYSLKAVSDDPRRQWGQLRQAYRFPTEETARSCVMWQELDGIVERVELP